MLGEGRDCLLGSTRRGGFLLERDFMQFLLLSVARVLEGEKRIVHLCAELCLFKKDVLKP